MKEDKEKKAKDTPAPAGVSLSQMDASKQKGKRTLVILAVFLVIGGAGYGAYRTYVWYKDRTASTEIKKPEDVKRYDKPQPVGELPYTN